MLTKLLGAVFGVMTFAMLAIFAWGSLRSAPPLQPHNLLGRPVAILSEQLSDGLIEAQVYITEGLKFGIEVQFSPNAISSIPTAMAPEINLQMVGMHMDGFDQPLELVSAGSWRSAGELPMAGMWIMNVGYGEDLAEVLFTVEPTPK